MAFSRGIVIFLSFRCNLLKNMQNIRNYWKKCRKMTKMTILGEKSLFCNLQNCICLSFFLGVMWWIFCHFLSFWRGFSKALKGIKLFERWQKNDKNMAMLREKCNFCNLQNCHFFWGHFLMQFLAENLEKDNVSRKMQFLQPAKITKNTNKTTDQNSNSNDKNDKNDNHNDRQN